MFSSRLRHSAIWAPIVPALANPACLNLRESDILSDLSVEISVASAILPQPIKAQSSHILHVVPLTTTDLELANESQDRLRSLADGHLQAGAHVSRHNEVTDLVIVFLASPSPNSSTITPMHAYLQLQTMIATDPALRRVPILLITRIEEVVDVVMAHVSALRMKASRQAGSLGSREAIQKLLPLCTTTPPLSEHGVLLLTDLYPSIKDLAAALVTDEGKERVRRIFAGDASSTFKMDEGEGVVEFWRDEWLCE